jgi:glycosyltransferase involved in cell wall biosynthesis
MRQKSEVAAASPVFVANHTTGGMGPIDYYETYLWRHGHDTVRIDHPLDRYDGHKSLLRRNGRVEHEWRRRQGGPRGLIRDFMSTIRAVLRAKAPVAVGSNNFDTYSILAARRLLLFRKPRVIYFGADFSEDRFSSGLMNWIYTYVERTAIRHADLVVSNTHRAESKRLELGLDQRKSVIVPNGVLLAQPEFKPKTIRNDHFIFVGAVTREHGLYELVATIKPLIGKLIIIGQGEDWDRVLRLCVEQRIPHEAHTGWSHEAVLDYLRDFDGFGLAPYNRFSKWTYYCSPLKVSEYIASGVPAICSSVPEVAGTITADRLGFVYENGDLEEIRAALDAFDAAAFHLRAQRFYAAYNSDTLYERIGL